MKFSVKEIVLIGIFAALTAIMAQISIPLKPVPITFQIFAVFLSAFILGSKCATFSQIVYVLLGAIGLPVFSKFSGGTQIILGPTGGYIIAFPIVAFVVGKLVEKKAEPSKIYLISVALLGLILCYSLGAAQLGFILKLSVQKSLSLGVLPFIPLDIVKLIIASVLGYEIRKILLKANLLSPALNIVK